MTSPNARLLPVPPSLRAETWCLLRVVSMPADFTEEGLLMGYYA